VLKKSKWTQKWNKGPKGKVAAVSEEEQDIWQNIHEGHRAEDCKVHIQVYGWAAEDE
jgi:hypothetical protein